MKNIIKQKRTIKLDPKKGCDWSKVTAALLSSSYVLHQPKDIKINPKNVILVEQGWCPSLFNIVDCGDYLSLKLFKANIRNRHIFSSVGNYKTYVANNNQRPSLDKSTFDWLWYSEEDNDITSNHEIRFYKDHKIVILLQFKNYIYSAERIGSFGSRGYGGNTYKNAMIWPKDRRVYKEYKQYLLKNGCKEIFTDEDARKTAHRMTKADLRLIRDVLAYSTDSKNMLHYKDQEWHYCRNASGYDRGAPLAEETIKIIKDFFDYENKEILKENTAKATIKYCPYYHRDYDKIGEMRYSDQFVCLVFAQENIDNKVKTQIKYVTDFIKTNASELLNRGENKNIVLRIQDIACFCQKCTNEISLYCSTSDNMRIVLINMKTYKKVLAEACYKNKWSWAINIPSTDNIISVLNKFDGSSFIEWKNTTKEIFQGSVIEYLLENCSKFSSLLQNKIDTYVFKLLCHLNDHIVEKLIKTNLFNLCYWYLMRKRDFTNEKDVNTYYYRTPRFVYDPKQTKLTKIFSLNMDLLKVLDGILETSEYLPLITGYDKVFGQLQPEQFKKLLEVLIKLHDDVANSPASYYRIGINDWKDIPDILLKGSTNDKINNILDYGLVCGETYRDYLKMRKEIEALKDTHPDLINLNNYPVKPKRSIKYIRCDASWRSYYDEYPYYDTNGMVEFSQEMVTKKIMKKYYSSTILAYEPGERYIKGVFVELSPADTVQFLHDDITKLLEPLQNEAQNIQFKQAIKRVLPLEWKDEQLGLEAIAPKKVEDLIKEGKDNEFCVGGFVGPIISNDKENVMFIRQIGKQDEAYYCIELCGDKDNLSINQIHTYRNLSLTAEDQQKAYEETGRRVFEKTFDIIKFLKGWCKATKKIREDTIASHYGALCAKYR